MPKFFESGNKLLRCYNLFPRQFPNIDEMTRYLPTVKAMGFNAVWINPFQEAGGVIPDPSKPFLKRDKNTGVKSGNDVTNSLYAMKRADHIDKRFSTQPNAPENDRAEIDRKAVCAFTSEARRLNIVPMFDLVLNHVAANSPLYEQHSSWFNKDVHPQFRDARAFNYDNPEIRDEIIEKFWKPYIKKYFIDYGFEGVRIDAVGHVRPEVRQVLYNYIYQLCEENGKPRPVILDEALMADKSFKDVADDLRLDGKGPSHITTGTYYATRDEYGGMPAWTKEENGEKMTVIFENKDKSLKLDAHGGCINFSGNHDHRSLAMNVLFEMAKERIRHDPIMNPLYERVKYEFRDGKKTVDEGAESTFLYSYEKDIIYQMKQGKRDVINEFKMRMRDKVAMAAFTSSGGWYALCGDEYGDIATKSVFMHANGRDLNPEVEHKIFSHEAVKHSVDEVLKQMAIDDILKDSISPENQRILSHNGLCGAYGDLNNQPELQNRLLTAYIDNIKSQINCGVQVRCQEFHKRLEARGINVTFNKEDYKEDKRNAENKWKGLDPDMYLFMKQTNTLLEKLPESKLGCWSEVIRLPSASHIFIAVRKNGLGFESPTDIVIMNLSPDKPFKFGKEQLHELACQFQLRTVKPEDQYQGNVHFDSAYKCINECRAIHCDDAIQLADELKVSSVANAAVFEGLHSRGLFAASRATSIHAGTMRQQVAIASTAVASASSENETTSSSIPTEAIPVNSSGPGVGSK